MNRTLYVIYDGQTLIPEGNIDLLPNQRLIYISLEQPPQVAQSTTLKQIADEAIDMGIVDLAEQHDHYLYGVEKQ